MSTTIILLFVIGLLGVFAQALKKMNELNKRNNGNFSFREYIKIERFSLGVSFIAIVAFTIIIYMVPELSKAGYWLICGQFAMGWFGQSGLEFVMGQAKKKIGLKAGATKEEIDELQ